ncbi:glycosyltransferase [Modestobacter altitudinis]|uniref:glycosyltransferase n=1 Tax=Modestobacter altitudinis TaxID=2213158 RepID=UPI001486D02B|nr:glycosyltransferase [Modestobacter altitudinis]
MTSTRDRPVGSDGETSLADVVIGIVTYRRPEPLRALLQRLAELDSPADRTQQVLLLVVDNSPDSEARPVVATATLPDRFTVQYVPHGAGNIASGRNAVLTHAVGRAPFLALIDDDELPDADWLDRLLDAQQRTSAELVIGPVLADYPTEAPQWVRRPVFHSVAGDGPGWVAEAHAGNLLLSTGLVERHGLRFDETLGRSGGEDQLFSRQAVAAGARIWFEPSAVVHEPVPSDRLSVRYLLRREYRKGGTLGILDRSRPGWPAGRPVRRVLVAGYWAAAGLTAVVRAVVARDRARTVEGLMKVTRAAGMVDGLRGRTYDLYGTAPAQETERPRVAVVAAEGPEYQRAGHGQHLRGILAHHRDVGHDVVVLLTGSRAGFLVRRAGQDGLTYRAPGLLTVGGWQVVTSPAAVAGHVAWAVFRRLPHRVQTAVDRVRTARRSRAEVDHVLGTWLDPATSHWVARELATVAPEVVLFNTVFSVPDPLLLPPSVRVTGVISHDVVHERASSFRAAGHRVDPAGFAAEHEAAVLARMDLVLAIQWDDVATLAALAPGAAVVVTPVVVDVEPVVRERARSGRCLFIGSGSLHNVEALQWFLRAIWPEVRRRRPDAELHVVGTVCARLASVPAGVVLRGEVRSLAEEYEQASVAVAPLRAGSGLKVKVVEALCHGVPTVTTSVGAQGLGGLRPAPYRLADSAGEFTDAVVELLADGPARREVESAARAAAGLFSAGQAYAELDRYLARVGVGSEPAGVVLAT